MRPILVTITGTPFYMSNDVGARGGGDAAPILAWLGKQFPGKVFAVGQLRGELPEGVQGVDINLRGIALPTKDGWFDSEDFKERMTGYRETLLALDPLCWLDFFGPTPTWSHPDNPMYANVYDFGVLYSLPQLWLMQHLNAPRYGIVTDPKCYKRDGEMATMWPSIIPKAVLSQEQCVIPKRIQGKHFRIHAAYSGCEFWQTWNTVRSIPVEKKHQVLVASNVHYSSSQLPSKRRTIWRDKLIDQLPDGTAVCGHGWDTVDTSRLYCYGQIKSLYDVFDLMNASVGGPMIPQKVGFNTTKPRMYALNNCMPYLYGNGSEPFTYDIDERILPLDSKYRWRDGVPILSDDELEEGIQRVLMATEPNFTTLLNLIDETLEHGTTRSNTDLWKQNFGGYYYA